MPLRFSMAVAMMNRIKNECIRGMAQVEQFGGKHGLDIYRGGRILRIKLPGKRKRGRPPRRFMDIVKECWWNREGC